MTLCPKHGIHCVELAIRSRRTVTGLSAMIWNFERKPLPGLGSMVTRKSGASTSFDAIWCTTTDACCTGNASVWTITAELSLL
jgi:hypothetical protein